MLRCFVCKTVDEFAEVQHLVETGEGKYLCPDAPRKERRLRPRQIRLVGAKKERRLKHAKDDWLT